MKIDFPTASFKDFENIPELDAIDRARYFQTYLDYLKANDHLNYRILSTSGCGPEMDLLIDGKPRTCTCLVSNDYLGFTRHPAIREALIRAITEFGSGSGASPAIGGHFIYHQQLEDRIASFYRKTDAILFTTGYTANSATLQCLLKKEDIAILDMEVHASVLEGCQLTNVKRFLHNDMDMLEMVLRNARDKYRTKLVVIDGVYSQNGDIARLDRIAELAHHYGAYLLMDDAHGTGVIGDTGRGVIERYDLYGQVDIITGTFSKALGHIGGYVVADTGLVNFLKYQARQHLFSTTATPATMGILRALDLLDEEPFWRDKLWENIRYLKSGLLGLGLNVGESESAIIPVKIGDIPRTLETGKLLLQAGIYANPIMYPAVAKRAPVSG